MPKELDNVDCRTSLIRGARSYRDIDHAFIRLLETGSTESRTHVEQMSLDMGHLLASAFPSLATQADFVNGTSFLNRMRSAAKILWEALGDDAIEVAAQSASDTVRGWGAFVVGYIPDLTFSERLSLVRPFAGDSHFAVREWAWLSLRSIVSLNTLEAIESLYPWVLDPIDRMRRFATEITRPRGVWCGHLKQVKEEPWLARRLLDAVAADPSRYVQNSVGNWLNDASKSQPSWVMSVCAGWELSLPKETAYVRQRALRTLPKLIQQQ